MIFEADQKCQAMPRPPPPSAHLLKCVCQCSSTLPFGKLPCSLKSQRQHRKVVYDREIGE